MVCLSVISKNLKNEEDTVLDWAASAIKKKTFKDETVSDLKIQFVVRSKTFCLGYKN